MSGDDRATRVALLAGQGCALGLTMAWILIPASTIFLEEYGPERLPVTYIGAACAGVLSSSALSAALRRKPLARVATDILVAMAVLLVGAWALLRADAVWASFALLVLVPIVVPVGFVFIVGQAGATNATFDSVSRSSSSNNIPSCRSNSSASSGTNASACAPTRWIVSSDWHPT